ncbi:MAG: Gfo/Idh/MocA family oxidoreductase [Candidatus Brocadiaceae bacterium]
MESWKRKLRMGMVGGGQGAFIGAVHRMVAALDMQIDLVAGCFSRDYENTEETGEQLYLDPSRCYRTYEEMAEAEAALPEEERIDFVTIVTPNVSHFPIAKTFLEAGFHVVCDKPMTYTLEEAEQLVKLVEESGLVFALTHNYTGNSLVRQAREMFTSGQMGDVRKVMVEYLQEFLMYPHEKEGSKQAIWRTDPEQSGIAGTIGDVGTHAFNLLEYITGEKVVALCCDKSTFLPDRELDEDANMLIRLEGGGKGILSCSQIATGEENHLWVRIYASEGAVIWDQENPNYMSYYRYGEPREVYTRGRDEYLTDAAMEVTRVPWGHPEGYLEAFANIYCDVVTAIRAHIDGEPLGTEQYKFPTVYDGLRGMKFIYAAVESAEHGSTWVEID